MHLPLYKIEISGIIIIVRCASVAQSVEQGTENPRVIGSIPIGGTLYAAVAHLVERHLAKVEVASSSLVGRSICGSLAQLGEHLPYKQRVSGSSPLTSTMWPGSSVG